MLNKNVVSDPVYSETWSRKENEPPRVSSVTQVWIES